jgi:hypothetical protein
MTTTSYTNVSSASALSADIQAIDLASQDRDRGVDRLARPDAERLRKHDRARASEALASVMARKPEGGGLILGAV